MLNEEWFEPDIYCYHLAQIAHQVYLLRCSLPFTGQKAKASFDDFLKLFKRKKKEEARLKLLDKPLQRTKSGKLISPEWQKRIDAREAQLKSLLGLSKDEPEEETEDEKKTMRRKTPRRKK